MGGGGESELAERINGIGEDGELTKRLAITGETVRYEKIGHVRKLTQIRVCGDEDSSQEKINRNSKETSNARIRSRAFSVCRLRFVDAVKIVWFSQKLDFTRDLIYTGEENDV